MREAGSTALLLVVSANHATSPKPTYLLTRDILQKRLAISNFNQSNFFSNLSQFSNFPNTFFVFHFVYYCSIEFPKITL